MMGLGPYRNVEIRGDLVIGEQYVDGLTDPWMKFRGSERLMKIHHVWNVGSSAVFREIWSLSDGYGEPGFVPVQGYDWSGIRDSTTMATLAMLDVAERWWEAHNPNAEWPWRLHEAQKA